MIVRLRPNSGDTNSDGLFEWLMRRSWYHSAKIEPSGEVEIDIVDLTERQQVMLIMITNKTGFTVIRPKL